MSSWDTTPAKEQRFPQTRAWMEGFAPLLWQARRGAISFTLYISRGHSGLLLSCTDSVAGSSRRKPALFQRIGEVRTPPSGATAGESSSLE